MAKQKIFSETRANVLKHLGSKGLGSGHTSEAIKYLLHQKQNKIMYLLALFHASVPILSFLTLSQAPIHLKVSTL